jgi:hypothetical protein
MSINCPLDIDIPIWDNCDMTNEYLIPSEIELTQEEIAMLRSHGITVWESDKMSKQELQEAYDWLIANGY